ncbi:hypothetical protein SISSUDRAFT_1065334 [Sistotremastrum suecicum HHB10207 ss-3]|uniref:Uncharacterized protein n=1 Tax=Sistotremastrum suecicum HHB10207 ss-3 TaxID=1314776 RepID=A0A165ZLP5_9AGAM|nr:hypothetical protein SISSUDRAFT_1065334 [Sistotremastrum suecicum HHB10207 ss-3]
MFSFTKFTLLASLAVSSLAAPLFAPVSVANIQGNDVDVLNGAKALSNDIVHRRGVELTTVAGVFADVAAVVPPVIAQIEAGIAAKASVETFEPYIVQLATILDAHVTDLAALRGVAVATILASLDGKTTLTANVVAHEQAVLINSIITVFAHLEAYLDTKIYTLASVIARVNGSIEAYVNATVALVAGVQVVLGGLINTVDYVLVAAGLSFRLNLFAVVAGVVGV